MNIGDLVTPELEAAVRVLVVAATLVHMLIAVVLFLQAARINQTINTPNGNWVAGLGLVHILVLLVILLLVIFY
jgi:succinate dehydrogenase/fumarate reductase cytochrome b subunit